jgi:uncharacterized membrane protein
MDYALIKTLHVLSATLLLGTGLGSAYYLWRGNRDGDPRVVASVARHVVQADWLFTTPAVIVQPLSGLWLARLSGWPVTTPWIAAGIALYILAGACWLPVVWLQIQMREMAETAVAEGRPLPERHVRIARIWERLGYPAFAAVIGALALMVVKPDLGSW